MARPVVFAVLPSGLGSDGDVAWTSDRTLLVGGSVFTVDAVVSDAPDGLLALLRMRGAPWATTDVVFAGGGAARTLARVVGHLQTTLRNAPPDDDGRPDDLSAVSRGAVTASVDGAATPAAPPTMLVHDANGFAAAATVAADVVALSVFFGTKQFRFSAAA